ncbi:tRNA threonylcarbamoyladenosine dehydratase, partial [Campylobacter jejuni]|nr:tRNA threonylcarbamoyladenosine dehydratase [Campylobacter jejuni]
VTASFGLALASLALRKVLAKKS